MNLHHTSGRNKPLIYSVSDVLMIGINGPRDLAWNAEKHVISRLKFDKHDALDKPTMESQRGRPAIARGLYS